MDPGGDDSQRISAPRQRGLALLALVLGVAGVQVLVAGFLPDASGRLGAGYAFFLPQLVDGDIWRQVNGLGAVPWFTPSFCGGAPRFPDPHSLYFSVPQQLTSLLDPIRALRWTLLAFAGVAALAFYRLARRGFGVSRSLAVLGAWLFVTSGLFVSSLRAGHLGLHAVALLPLVPLWLFGRRGGSRWTRATEAAGAATALAYLTFYALPELFAPALLFTGFVALLQGAAAPGRFRARRAFGRSLLVAPLWLALVAAKLLAVRAWSAQLPPAAPPELAQGPAAGAVAEVARALAFGGDPGFAPDSFGIDFGSGPVPFLLLGLAALASARRLLSAAAWRSLASRRAACLVVALLLLALPLLPELRPAGWPERVASLEAWLGAWTPLRWLPAYPPALILLAVLAAEHTPALRRRGLQVAGVGCALVLGFGWQSARDRAPGSYDPAPVLEVFSELHAGRFTPGIHSIAADPDEGRSEQRPHALLRGVSPRDCLAGPSGPSVASLARAALVPGPVLELRDGAYNLLDPSCLIFPQANDCEPGQRFRASRRDEAEAFVSYRPFFFEMPAAQRRANATSLVAWLGLIAALALCALGALAGAARRAFRALRARGDAEGAVE